MRLGTKVVRQSPRLQNRGVEDGECSSRTRSMKKKGRALSPVRLNFGKRPRISVNLSEAIGSKSNSDSDFDCMVGKGKTEVVEVDARIQLSSRFLKIWDFYYDENTRNFHGKATYWNDYTVPEKIFNKLTGPQFQLFMRISDVSGYSGKESVLVAKYFGESRVTRAFIQSVYEEASFDNDEEAVRSLSIAVKGSARRLKSGFIEYNIFKERILGWKEIGKSPTNEQLNDFVFGSGHMRVQLMKPSLEESCEMTFLDGFRFLEVNDGGFGVDNNADPNGKTMFSGSSVSREELKVMLDERLKPLEDSISSVKESTDLLKKDVREQLQFFEGNIIKQIKDLLRVVCPDKCSDVNNIGKDFSDPNVEKLSKVTESRNEPTVIVKESFSVARDLEGKKQSVVWSNGILAVNVVSNVISSVVRGSKDPKAREFPSFQLLSQESLSDGQQLDCEKSLDIVGEGNANVENEEQESSPNSKSHFDDIIFTTQDIKMIEEMEHSVMKKDVVGKRAAVKSAVLRSPYTTDFGSVDCKELVLYPKDIRKGISAFPDECMKFPNESEVLLFDEWFKLVLIQGKGCINFLEAVTILTLRFLLVT
ncbi:hypothetical protein OROMI_001502 [Orobanche minor]